MSWDIHAEDGAVIVAMNSNPVNKMNPAFFDDLHEALDRIDRSHPGKPLVVTAQGQTFSAGLDLDHAFSLFRSDDPDAILKWFERFRDCLVRVFELPRRVVAAVNGNAFAGGLILALCCEHRIGVAGRGRYALNEVLIGIPMPAVYTEIVRHAVGTTAAAQLILDGRVFSAEEALASGLVHRLVPEGDLLLTALGQARVVNEATYSAYRVSKANLIAPTVNRIRHSLEDNESAALRALMEPAAQRAHAAALARLKEKSGS
jgi:enoyl-CoA hydratase